MPVELSSAEAADLLAATARPGVSKGLRELGVVILRVWPRRVFVPEEHLTRVREIIAGPSAQKPRTKRAARRRVGTPDTLYDRDEIKRVVLLWRNRETSPQQISVTSLARRGFSRAAVRRVIRLDEHHAFSLGPRGGLSLHGIDGEFRAAPRKVSLRALERALGLEPLS